MTSTNVTNWRILLRATNRPPRQTFLPEDRPRSHQMGLPGRRHVTDYAGFTLKPKRGLARLFAGGTR